MSSNGFFFAPNWLHVEGATRFAPEQQGISMVLEMGKNPAGPLTEKACCTWSGRRFPALRAACRQAGPGTTGVEHVADTGNRQVGSQLDPRFLVHTRPGEKRPTPPSTELTQRMRRLWTGQSRATQARARVACHTQGAAFVSKRPAPLDHALAGPQRTSSTGRGSGPAG